MTLFPSSAHPTNAFKFVPIEPANGIVKLSKSISIELLRGIATGSAIVPETSENQTLCECNVQLLRNDVENIYDCDGKVIDVRINGIIKFEDERFPFLKKGDPTLESGCLKLNDDKTKIILTAIQEGRFSASIRYKFLGEYDAVSISNVAGRTGILLHRGRTNTIYSEGCILVGKEALQEFVNLIEYNKKIRQIHILNVINGPGVTEALIVVFNDSNTPFRTKPDNNPNERQANADRPGTSLDKSSSLI